MKILNICVNGMYTDGFSYHENLLPKYHKKNGHDTYIMASEYIFDSNGEVAKDTRREYTDENGVKIYRLPIKGDHPVSYHFKHFEGFRKLLEKIAPDIIFCHLFQFLDAYEVIRYKKQHPEVKLYFDSHSDYSNSARNWLSKNIQHRMLWRRLAQKALPYAERFYGVLPARVEFIKELYGIPADKVELLVMGSDDEFAEAAATPECISRMREENGIAADDLLIVNGGKLDHAKMQTLLLMDAVNHCEDPRVKLLVFGSVEADIRAEFENRLSDRVKYLGWKNSNDSYPLFAGADMAFFPGRHSVFWEQVVGQGIPIVAKYWNGTDDIKGDGNCVLLTKDSEEEIAGVIRDFLCDEKALAEMKCKAQKFKKNFSYRYLAEKSIQ